MGTRRAIHIINSLMTFCILVVLFTNAAAPGAALPDDNYEPNDIYEMAYDQSTFEQTWLSDIAGLGVQDDQDWYKLYISPGFERLVIDLVIFSCLIYFS